MIPISKLIESEIKSFVTEREFKLKESNHERVATIFSQNVDEDSASPDKENVLSLIKNNEWEQPDPNAFYNSLMQSKHGAMLTDYTPAELGNMKLFKLKDHNIGFALKNIQGKGFKEIVAVHNNEPVSGIGNELVRASVNNGGCYLDHFDGYLSNLYASMGFQEYKRDKFDPQYDPDGTFSNKYGEQDVIYRVHKNCIN